MEDRPTVAVAESCTGGLLASELAATPGSGDWFVGGVVAYDSSAKYRLLGVPEGPVISAGAAAAMAGGVRALMGAEIGISTTGVAGPDSEEGLPVGLVFIGVSHPGGTHTVELDIDGDPDQVKAAAVERALEELALVGRKLVTIDPPAPSRGWIDQPSGISPCDRSRNEH
ncbi:MAG TPA: CinA family protein [Acidimicrobiia bacterium]|nr:CinA family protein [Acidimicrobiia bacterium]